MSGKTALVVGGGAAGVSAAFRLQQAGMKVRLVERDERVGGRTRTERIDGYIVDVAAGLMPGSYEAVYRLMNDAGLHDLLAPMTSPTAIARDGKLHYLSLSQPARAMLSTPLLGWKSKLQFAKIGAKSLNMWKSLRFDSLADAAPYDTQSIAQYASRSLTSELYEYLVNPMEKLMYTVSGDEASVVDFFWCAKNLFHPKAYCVRGGMDRIVANVAAGLDVLTQTEVTSVEETGERVRVTLRGPEGIERTEVHDCCVIATPARDVPKIDRGLSPASRQFLQTLRYSVLTDLHLRLKSRPDEKAVLIMVPDSLDRDVAGILVDHNKGADRAPPGKGALSVYFLDRWAREMYDRSDAEIFEQGMEKVERIWPGIGALVEGYHVQRWDYAATVAFPGYYKGLAKFVEGLDLNRRVQLAGDYFSLASVNTAVTSGEIAAARLIEACR